MTTREIGDRDLGCDGHGGWYALYTRHQHEKSVASTLSGKGFETFLPLYTTVRQWRDRKKSLDLPLFPCYVFLRAGFDEWLEVYKTPGLCSVVAWSGEPALIPPAEIDNIRQLVGSDGKAEPYPFLRCGDLVRVKHGPLAGVEGILVRKKNVYRLVLSVELLQKSVSVEVDAPSVERLYCQLTMPPPVQTANQNHYSW